MSIIYINADNGRDDLGDGSKNNPYKTIKKSLKESKFHDIIYCQNSESHYLFDDQTITFRTIQGESPDKVIFDGENKNVNWIIGANGNDIIQISNITFENVVLTNSQPMLGIVASGHTFKINNCIFHNIQTFDGGSSYTSGVIGHRDNTSSLNLEVSNSLFYDIGKNEISFDGYMFGIRVSNCKGDDLVKITFTNCTIYQSADKKNILTYLFAIRDNSVDQDSKIKVVITNCIIKNNSHSPLYLYSYPFEDGSYKISSSDLCTLTSDFPEGDNIDDDPMFLDEENNDFRLRPNSPCKYGGKLL